MDTQSSSSFLDSFNFQRIVLTIAIVMLIAAMIFIGYSLYQKSIDVSWPPEVPQCPDFWSYDVKNAKCIPGPGQPTDSCEYNGIPGGTEGVPACPKSSWK